MKILIAEDDEISRRMLRKMLERYGQCDATEDGVHALAAFKQALRNKTPYDLVCLDIMMPVMDGQEALRRMREVEKDQGIVGSREVKVIMLSALGDRRSVVQAFYDGGATGYMVKPIQIDKLIIELGNLGLKVPNAPAGTGHLRDLLG